MDDYNNLTDEEKWEKYPDEFIDELSEELQNGDSEWAIQRAWDLGISIDSLVD